jgi:hypothetical protein
MIGFTLPPPIAIAPKRKTFDNNVHPAFEWYVPSVIPQRRMLGCGMIIMFTPIPIVKPTTLR